MENNPEENEVESVETDEEYEFEASQFFDFTRPEFDYEIEEAERWFEASGDYPPSPFIVKLNLEKILYTEILPSIYSKASHNNIKSISSSSSSNAISSSKKDSKASLSLKGSQSPTGSDVATKRQKLSVGYLRKILEPRLSQQRKKSQPTLPEFQVFHLKTMERANHHASKFSENPPTEQFSKKLTLNLFTLYRSLDIR
ncbi:Unknown protein [Striga hermonthica]|uniref:TPX2 central domain-containing protein n=1 Tax=Striga hermonthica TaxID=68872 RepID=A0A9N7RN03_STRHE|nr:Unknown protein [Striga hermonthica]